MSSSKLILFQIQLGWGYRLDTKGFLLKVSVCYDDRC